MNILRKISIVFFLGVVSLSCEKDKKSEPSKHPYFSCKINGEPFYSSGKWQCVPRTFNYYPNGFLGAPSGYTLIEGFNCSEYISIGIRVYGLTPTFDTISFTSNQVDSVRPYFFYPDDEVGDILVFDELQSGSLRFDQFSDKSGDNNGLVSGTFEFTVRNEELDSVVVVTDGQFQYIIDYEWY